MGLWQQISNFQHQSQNLIRISLLKNDSAIPFMTELKWTKSISLLSIHQTTYVHINFVIAKNQNKNQRPPAQRPKQQEKSYPLIISTAEESLAMVDFCPWCSKGWHTSKAANRSRASVINLTTKVERNGHWYGIRRLHFAGASRIALPCLSCPSLASVSSSSFFWPMT